MRNDNNVFARNKMNLKNNNYLYYRNTNNLDNYNNKINNN